MQCFFLEDPTLIALQDEANEYFQKSSLFVEYIREVFNSDPLNIKLILKHPHPPDSPAQNQVFPKPYSTHLTIPPSQL